MKRAVMPQIGESPVEPVRIRAWMVQPGTRVVPGQVIVQVETDKSAFEIEATETGTLTRILVGEGCSALPGAPIAEIEEER